MPFDIGGFIYNGDRIENDARAGIVTNGLVLHLDAGIPESYPLSGTTWYDLSGNSDGTITNGPTYNNQSGGVINFDGVNDHINLGTQVISLAPNAFSVEGFFKTSALSAEDTYQNIWGAGRISTSSNFTGISIGNLTGGYADESFHAMINAGTLQMYVREGSGFYFDGKYHHFVVNVSPGNNTIYIDGVQKTVTYAAGSIDTDVGGLDGFTNDAIYVGRRAFDASAGHFNGNIPLVRMYNRALSPAEIAQNFNAQRARFGI